MRDGQAGSLRLRCSSALAPPLNVCPCGPPRNLAVRSSGNPQLIEFNVSVYSRRSDHFKLSYCGLASLRLRIPQYLLRRILLVVVELDLPQLPVASATARALVLKIVLLQ